MGEVRLPSGELVWQPTRSGDWYRAALNCDIKSMRGLVTQRNAKALSGDSVDKLMKAYRDLEWSGSDLMPSRTLLAERSKLSINTVGRAQQWLIENGWLEVVGRFKVRRHGWMVRLAIPSEGRDGSMYDWTGVHPERKIAWNPTGLPKVAPSNNM